MNALPVPGPTSGDLAIMNSLANTIEAHLYGLLAYGLRDLDYFMLKVKAIYRSRYALRDRSAQRRLDSRSVPQSWNISERLTKIYLLLKDLVAQQQDISQVVCEAGGTPFTPFTPSTGGTPSTG